MPASFHSELQAEDYSPRTRLARVEIDKNNQKSVMANASSKAREQSAAQDTPVESDEDDLHEPIEAQAQTNGTTAHTPSGDEKEGNDNEEQVRNTEHSPVEEDGTKIQERNELLEPAEDNVVPDDDEDSEDEASNAESIVVEDWRDASASIADASTRNNCVYVSTL